MSSSSSSAAAAAKKKKGITSFSSLRQGDDQERQGGGGGSDDGEQDFYVGGASAQGGSGLSVMDPRAAAAGGAGGGNDEVRRILEMARRMGAEQPPAGAAQDGAKRRKVTFYRNGFIVDDKPPLREKGTPENDQFLDAISKGICPPELLDQETRKPVDVAVEDRRGEDYRPPSPPPYVAFGGAGQSMGLTGEIENAIVPGMEAAPFQVPATPEIKVRITYPNNKKQVASFSKTGTVRNLLFVIESSGNVDGAYQILSTATGGQPKPIPLSQFDETLTAAKLAGAAVTVRIV